MKLALGLAVVLLFPSVAHSGDYWDRYWDFTRHLRNINWSIQDLNWTIYQQNLPPEEPAIPPLPSLKQSRSQQAADSTYSSVKKRQHYKKDRRARTYAKLRDEAIDRELRDRGIVIDD
jgi:hypothetical protein